MAKEITIDRSGRPADNRSESHVLLEELAGVTAELKLRKQQVENLIEILDMYVPRALQYSGSIPGLEIAGRVMPHNGFAGGDLAMPLLFIAPEDINNYTLEGSKQSKLWGVEYLSAGRPSEIGLFIADPPGHDPVDGYAAAMVYQAARMGVKYELSMNGEVTSGLMRRLHDTFYPGQTSPEGITLLGARLRVVKDGEKEVAAGSWQSAGHPTPRIFRRNELRFEPVDESKFNMSAAIGYFPGDAPENNYSPNPFTLNKGDIALFYSDGLSDHGRRHKKRYFPQHTERVLRGSVNGPIEDISDGFAEDILTYCTVDDDITYFLVRKT